MRDAPNVCVTCIHLTLETTLGDADGPGVIEESQFVTSDTQGRFWVSQRDYIAVFDSGGMFVADVGRSGQGPLEFSNPTVIYCNEDGEVSIFDGRNLRVTVVDMSFHLVRDFRLPMAAQQALALPGRDRYLVNGFSPDEERLIQPLHLLEGPRITRSFGRTTGSGGLGELKRLAADDQGRVFVADHFAYVVEMWTADGQFRSRFERPGLWEPTDPWRSVLPTPANPALPSFLSAIHTAGGSYLWVVSWVPQEDALDHLYEVVRPDGRRALDFDDWNAVYDSVIEVIDVDTGTIVARKTHPEVIGGFFGSDHAHGPLPMPDGSPRIAIWMINLENPRTK